ncbi:hypothetical protein AOQ84DRAFT_351769 [Glonium stellatum]|uniref:Uncharacterized protein n=1 Tax=Glonium stellatum TaxID=574774 RepID=A0A8E2FB14_9PEZI|nr:hypothetical protein AOQ84DRAFT_351769 [Glonium stellatum]
MSSSWTFDRISSYCLERQTILMFLKRKFGDGGAFTDSDFDVQQFESDHYIFRVPQKLTENERTELLRLREDDVLVG